MKLVCNKTLTGERAAYGSVDTRFENCCFCDGESPLKECRNIAVTNCTFQWKYPLWYCRNATVDNTVWQLTGRSGVWYTQDLTITNSLIGAPKQFRRCRGVTLTNCKIPVAEETMWGCEDVNLDKIEAVGNYFGMNCRNIKLHDVKIDGDYCFDGASDIVAENCIFNTKDAFWNTHNVVLKNCTIIGEYFAWNSSNITLIDCTIESHQGFCYIDGLKLVNCKIFNTDLAFELCTDVDAEICSPIDSIKNPLSGRIRVQSVGQLILDKNVVDTNKIVVEVINN